MKVIAFTRPQNRLESSISLAEGMGFKTVAAPSLKILPVEEGSLVRFSKLLLSKRYDCLIFTSATAVDKVFNFFDGDLDYVSQMNRMEIIAIGLPTSIKLQENGIEGIAIPDIYTSEGLLQDFGKHLIMKNVCLLRSDKGTSVLKKGLESLGANVDEVFVYRLEAAPISDELRFLVDSAIRGVIDAFVFTSALSVKAFFDNALKIADEKAVRMFLSDSFVAAIGKPTWERLVSNGIRVDLVPSKADFEIMLKEIKHHFETLDK